MRGTEQNEGANSRSRRVLPLDGWRAISVGLVVLCHLAIESHIAPHYSAWIGEKLIQPLIAGLGTTGVNIFFVISGYVIARGLIEESDRGAISLGGFYLRRIFRIVPPLITYILFVLLLANIGALPQQATGTIWALSFTCNFLDCGGWWGGHTWSLAYEEQFYLVVPLLFVLFWTPGRRLFRFLPFGLTALAIALAVTGYDTGATYAARFVGIAAGVAWAADDLALRKMVAKLPRGLAALLPAGLLVAERIINTRYTVIGETGSAAIITLMLCYTTYSDRRIAGLLSLPALTEIGRISYGIYLWQQLATAPVAGAGLGWYAMSVSACLAWAALSFHYFEKPLIALSHRLLARKRQARVKPLVSAGRDTV
jgi:peptidoglycan/LPS O-acetylase OafA/YrhL